LRALSLCTCCRHYPGAAAGCLPRSSHPAVSVFRDSTVGSARTSSFSRFARRSLTLRPAHSRGHQFVTAIRGLQTFRHLHACPGCFRRERSPGGPCTHRKAPPCHSARGKRTFRGGAKIKQTVRKRISHRRESRGTSLMRLLIDLDEAANTRVKTAPDRCASRGPHQIYRSLRSQPFPRSGKL
jgi:hypothetical protein